MRKILFLLIILNVFILTSCLDKPEGVVPTHDFSINEYYQDNCIILHSENFIINGESEPGVLLTAELYNSDDKKVEYTSCIADIEGKFTLTLSAPKASFNSYKLIINDSVNSREIKNVKFGEIWLFAGESYNEYNNLQDLECEDVSFYTFIDGTYNWSQSIDDSNENYIEGFAKQLSLEVNMPIGIIDATLDAALADSWLSFEAANRYLRVKNYLTDINRLIENDEHIVLKSNNLSSMYKTFIEPLKEINIRGILWNQGNSQIDSNFKMYSNDYSYLLMILFSELQTFFDNDIIIFSIQENSFGDKNYDYLRGAQAIPTFQVKNVNLIPTYDCYKEKGIEFDIEMFNNRMVDSLVSNVYGNNDNFAAISYNNIVVSGNEYEIIFEKELLDIEELIGVTIYDELNNPLEFDFIIDNNKLIISLEDEEQNAKYIYYGFGDMIYQNNLKTDAGIPIIPFFIELDVDSVRK